MEQKSTGKDVVTINPSGPVSLIVTLPHSYVKANGLKKGAKMTAHFIGDRITYKPLNLEDIPPVE